MFIFSALARLMCLALLTSAGHLLLLWLWHPLVEIPPPLRVTLEVREERPPQGTLSAAAPEELTLVFGGDTAPTDAANTVLYQNGFEYPYSATLDLIQSADLAVVNLEAPVTDSLEPFALYKRYVYRVTPEAIPALKWAGVDAVSLANNHLLDYGIHGMRDTLKHLKAAGVVPVGAGPDVSAARRGVVFDVRGTRVGLLSYLEDSLMHSLYVRSFAWGRGDGVARLGAAQLKQDLARMRRAADLVVVLAHWGRNYTGITASQKIYGRLMVRYGADAVVGHHPHVYHPVGVVEGKPIIYSLGNYAFGTPGRDWLRHGLMARLVVQKKRLIRVELIPLLVQNNIVQYKPEQLVGEEAEEMLRGLARDSSPHGARISVKNGLGVLQL